MGYTATHPLEDLFRDEPMLDAGRRTTERVGADLHERVRHHTPVAKPPSPAIAGEWLAARKRAPGTLRESWMVGRMTITYGGQRMAIDVYTEDPVAPHVEWETAPHLIVPRQKPGEHGGVLRFWDHEGNTIFARVVHHPGTRGVHMMSTSLVEVAASWQSIGREEIDRWSQEQVRGL